MIDIHFEINGRRVNPNNFGHALEKAVLQKVQESVAKRVGSIRCPEHSALPKVTCKGRSLDSLSFEVSGCCEQLTKAVKAKLQ